MEQNTENVSSIFDNVAEFLSENSETLETLSSPNTDNNEKQTTFVPNKQDWSLGQAPVKTTDSSNFEIFKQAFEEGSEISLIDANDTPENVQSAINMLLRTPEFKDFIGQYALSNDISQNISTIQQAITNQKNYQETPERVGEVDGQFFTGGEAYFLQELLNRIQNSEAVNTFFSQLRNKINTEIFEKIENKNVNENTENKKTLIGKAAEQGALNDMLLDPNFRMDQLDALSKTVKLFNEREGEIVEDATKEEIFNELKRIIGSPEYNQARTEELGYNPNLGHPDPEIQEYLKAKKEWAAKPYYEREGQPVKPKNFEERFNQPKIEYDRRLKEGLSHEEALKDIYTRDTNQQQIPKTNQTKSDTFNITPAPTTSLIQTTPLTQKEIIYETTSELPTGEMFVQAEEASDETSAEILANTQKTNTTLEGLTQLLATFMQQSLNLQTQQPASMPPLIPTGQTGVSQPGIPDVMLASGTGTISTIRNKFVYPI